MNKKWTPYLLISPFFVFFLIFGLYPIGYSLVMSFQKYGLGGKVQFVGLFNYKLMLTEDPYFWKSLINTSILLVFGSLLQHVFAIPLAIMLNTKFLKGRDIFKTTFFLPFITSTVSVVIIFTRIFSENYGFVNFVLKAIGLDPVRWMSDPTAIKVLLSIIINWKWIGWNTIIYLAGLQAIPDDLYEAARIDGASEIAQGLKITIPLLVPIIFFSTTMSVIGGMQMFDEPYVLLGGYELMGGTANSGLTTAFYILTQGMRWLRFGKASAISWLLFAVILILTTINRFVTKKINSDN